MNYDLLIDLHKANHRQGPGGDDQTQLALMLADLPEADQPLLVADIGCGTGAPTLVLAERLNADITAIDLFPEFLDILTIASEKRGLSEKITPLSGSMENLPFELDSLDLIWSEGAIYNLGFANGINYFKRFLKPGGILAVSEITWLTLKRPDEIEQYWNSAYPEVAIASDKIRILEQAGFLLKGYFAMPESCWLENYYGPLENSFDDFLALHNSEDAKSIIEAEKHEIALYKKYKNYYSYGFYIAQKI